MIIAMDAVHIRGTSGIETYARNICRAVALAAPDCEVQLHTSSRRVDEVHALFPGISNITVHGTLPHPLMLGLIGRPVTMKIRNRAWKKIAKTVDVIFFPDPMHFAPHLPNAVAMVHDIIPLYNTPWSGPHIQKPLMNALAGVVRDAKKIIVPSGFVRDEVLRVYQLPADHVRVVHEAASSDFHLLQSDPSVLRAAGIREGERFFLHVGRLDPRKNIGTIIDAFALLPAALRDSTRLLIVGRGPKDERADVDRHITDNKLEDRVTVYGGASDTDIVHLYNAAIGFVFASLSEGFGLPAVEAMQCGCPVISANSSSLPEVAGDAALYVDETSAASIAAAMATLATDESVRSQCKLRGIEQAKTFSWSRAAQESIALFNEVVRIK